MEVKIYVVNLISYIRSLRQIITLSNFNDRALIDPIQWTDPIWCTC